MSATELLEHTWAALRANDVKRAATLADQLIKARPKDPASWLAASHVASRMKRHDMALDAIDRAIIINPADDVLLLQRAVCLAALGKASDLLELLPQLSGRSMPSPGHAATLAALLMQSGLHTESLRHYEQAIRDDPDEGRHYYNLACVQRALGDTHDAEINFDKAIARNPNDFEAYKIRADLKTWTTDNNHIDELERVLASTDDTRGRVQLLYALAKEREDIGDHARAFQRLAEGADTRRRMMKYDVTGDLDTMTSLSRVFNAAWLDHAPPGFDCEEPIFIIGMPRTGTTLVERILDSHSAVTSAGELTNFAVEMTRLVREQGGQPPANRMEMAERAARIDPARLGQRYIESTRPFTGTSPRFIDKMPLNYLYTGLIAASLPGAKIISLERDPMDTCYSVYKQLFVDAYPFSYNLEELGRYYLAYRDLMEHWHAIMPGRIHTIRYEELVKDIEGHTRRMLEFCALPFEEQCLAFYKNPRAATTASSVQVREPAYTRSIGRWRCYEAELSELKRLLGAAAEG